MTTSNKRLLLFDIDGTLLRTKSVGRDATRAAMLEIFGTSSTIDTHVFGGKTDWLTLVELLVPHGYEMEIIGQRMSTYEQVAGRYITEFIGSHNVEVCPGALEVIEALRHDDRYLLGIVTGNVSTTAPIKLQTAGFDPAWFPIGAYGSEKMHRNELSALALERAIAYCGHPILPDDVFVIGDTLADIACARAVGAVAVGVCTGHNTRQELATAQPDYILDDLHGLMAII
jgi:phosphoglycolate phosphatase